MFENLRLAKKVIFRLLSKANKTNPDGNSKSTPEASANSYSAVIEINYDVQGAVTSIIGENKFRRVYLEKRVKIIDIPQFGSGRISFEVHERQADKIFKPHQPLDLLDPELTLVDPLIALTYAKQLPDRQLCRKLGTLFRDIQGRLCYLILDKDDGYNRRNDVFDSLGGGRRLSIGLWTPDSRLRPGTNLLVTRRFPEWSDAPHPDKLD